MLNSCSFIGRLGGDPESRRTQTDKHVATFSLAVQERKDGPTEWVRVVMWEKLADIAAQYLTKGSLVYISGRMQTRKWQDQNGNDRYSTEIVAYTMKMLGGGQHDEHQSTAPPTHHDDITQSTGTDVPF